VTFITSAQNHIYIFAVSHFDSVSCLQFRQPVRHCVRRVSIESTSFFCRPTLTFTSRIGVACYFGALLGLWQYFTSIYSTDTHFRETAYVSEMSLFCATRNFITVFTRTRHLEPDECSQTILFKIHFNIILQSVPSSSNLFFFKFLSKDLHVSDLFLCVLHG
jgi:hypothetical protein